MPARLQEHYTKSVREALTKEFSYKNPFEVPKLEKIVINRRSTTARPSMAPWPT